MASMSNCETIANHLASKLDTTIKTKAAGTDKSAAWCNGTLANNLTYQVLHTDAGTTNGIKTDAAYNVTIADSNITAQTSMPGTWSTRVVAYRAANAYNGSQNSS